MIIFTNDEGKAENSLGARLRVIRFELYGEHGVDTIGERLGVAPTTWKNYEDVGEVMPAQILLRFLELTGVDPLWLMRGEGLKYRTTGRRSEQDPNPSAAPLSKRTSRDDAGAASGRSNGRSPSADPG
jgi:hypothetical protein